MLWPMPVRNFFFASSNAILAEREEASLQTDVGPTGVGFTISLSNFYTVGFCPLFMLWDSVLWDFVLWDFVRRDFVLWDFVLWDSVQQRDPGRA